MVNQRFVLAIMIVVGLVALSFVLTPSVKHYIDGLFVRQSPGLNLEAGNNVGLSEGVSTEDYTTIVIDVTPSAGSGHTIQDEGSDLTDRTNLNFTGGGVTCTDNAGNDATDCSIAGGGGSPVILDLGDDGTNESTDLVEIATENDANSICVEESADKLMCDFAINWQNADSADAVATDAVAQIGDIASGLKSGADATLVTGTAGGSGNCAEWNADGDLVEAASAAPCGSGGSGDNVSVNSSGADTTANFLDGDIDFTLVDGGPGGPDNITATVECSGCVDISGDTNLTAGDHLTLTDDDIDLDAEIGTVFGSINIESPTDADDALFQIEFPVAITLSLVSCSTDTGTVTIQFDERTNTTPNSAGTDVLTSPLVCDSDREASAAFDNAAIAANAVLSLDIDATASDPGIVRINVHGDKDD